MGDECVFCAIVAGEAPASFVHEGEDVVAFMDINPVNAGHLLVIPRVHARSLESQPGVSDRHRCCSSAYPLLASRSFARGDRGFFLARRASPIGIMRGHEGGNVHVEK
jgi:hypothetical protein